MFQCVQARPELGSGLPLNTNMRGPYAGDKYSGKYTARPYAI